MQHQHNCLTATHIIQVALNKVMVMKHVLQRLCLLQHVWKAVPVIMRQLGLELWWDYSFEIFNFKHGFLQVHNA